MDKFSKKIVIIAAILAAMTIGIGAIGAHGLKQMVDANALASFETAVRYQMYHVIGLLVIGVATGIPGSTKKWVSQFFYFGLIFFSGSIYVLALKEVHGIEVGFLGPITPIGGFLLILGWLRLGYGLLTKK
ncbi:MAG: uncharacterized membrane protein YgdD (TMEM256/DUF423 family) [Candidatus Latescibacterota bacterium]|jgi:uncharacterized membrane protein YgdD (TMEM256/DUF423 family)